MEGSRHEKIIITIAAYVIGFVTAYIAFGINVTEPTNTVIVHKEKTVTEKLDSSILLNKSGLFYTKNGNMQILTANAASLGSALVDLEPTSGFHYEVIEALLSPNDQYVYFCEQLLSSVPECNPFIYDTEKNVIHTVYLPDGSRSVDLDGYAASWLEDGKLQVGDFVSSSSDQPWK